MILDSVLNITFLYNYIAMASKSTLNPDDPKQTCTDSTEIEFSPLDIAANQLSSIIDAVRNYFLSQKRQSQSPYQLIKLLRKSSYWMRGKKRLRKNLQPIQNLTKLDGKLADNVWIL